MKKLITEIRGEDTTELKGRLNDLRKEQFQLRFRGSVDAKTTRQREVRRTIARIMMVLGERALGAVPIPVAPDAADKTSGKTSGKAAGKTTAKAAAAPAASEAPAKAAAKKSGAKKAEVKKQ